MAKKGKFKCSACGRSFGMAAHLGHHISTVHARKPAAYFCDCPLALIAGVLYGDYPGKCAASPAGLSIGKEKL